MFRQIFYQNICLDKYLPKYFRQIFYQNIWFDRYFTEIFVSTNILPTNLFRQTFYRNICFEKHFTKIFVSAKMLPKYLFRETFYNYKFVLTNILPKYFFYKHFTEIFVSTNILPKFVSTNIFPKYLFWQTFHQNICLNEYLTEIFALIFAFWMFLTLGLVSTETEHMDLTVLSISQKPVNSITIWPI